MAHPCVAGATSPSYPHVREEVLHSGLLDPRERPRASARRRGGSQGEGLGLDPLGAPLAFIAPMGRPLGGLPLGPTLGAPFGPNEAH